MNDLLKISRAMKDSDEWRRTVEVACLLEGVEMTPRLLAQVTQASVDQIGVDDSTLEVDVSDVDVGAVAEAVAAYTSAPETLPLAETVATLQRQVQDLSRSVGELEAHRDTVLSDVQDLEPPPEKSAPVLGGEVGLGSPTGNVRRL